MSCKRVDYSEKENDKQGLNNNRGSRDEQQIITLKKRYEERRRRTQMKQRVVEMAEEGSTKIAATRVDRPI